MIVVLLALAAAMFNAASSVLQRVAARGAPDEASLRLRLVTYLLRRPAWLGGLAAMILAFVSQAAALGEGTLSEVQPILIMELLFVLAILAVGFHIRIGRLEWGGAVLTVVGLGGFLAVSHPSGGQVKPSLAEMGATGLGVAVLVASAIVASRRVGRASRAGTAGRAGRASRAALFGIAAGATFGLTAAIIKVFTDSITSNGLGAALAQWPPYALILSGLAALFFAENAFQAGPLTASQPALTITDPVVSVLIGVALFGDHLASSRADIVLEAVTFLTMAAGIVALSLSTHSSGAMRPRRSGAGVVASVDLERTSDAEVGQII
ncbi:MAG: DMT family transporter [Acidimicrobiales bacterium]